MGIGWIKQFPWSGDRTIERRNGSGNFSGIHGLEHRDLFKQRNSDIHFERAVAGKYRFGASGGINRCRSECGIDAGSFCKQLREHYEANTFVNSISAW